MTHPNIIIFIILAIYTDNVFSQSSFEKDLLSIEKEIFLCNDDKQTSKLNLQKLDIYIEHKDFSYAAFNEARRINYKLVIDSIEQRRFLWNASLIAKLNGEFSAGLHYYELYQQHYPDSSIEANLLAIMLNSQYDTSYIRERIHYLTGIDSRFQCLTCIIDVISFEIRNKNIYVVASAIVPGLGTALSGNIFKGFNSLALVGGVGYFVYALATNNLYINSIVWGTSLGSKFYAGNIQLTNRMLEKKEALIKSKLADSCLNAYNKIMIDFPVNPK